MIARSSSVSDGLVISRVRTVKYHPSSSVAERSAWIMYGRSPKPWDLCPVSPFASIRPRTEYLKYLPELSPTYYRNGYK